MVALNILFIASVDFPFGSLFHCWSIIFIVRPSSEGVCLLESRLPRAVEAPL